MFETGQGEKGFANLGSNADDDRDALDANAMRAILDALPAFVNVKDIDSRYVFMNAYQASTYGTTPQTARGRTAAQLLGDEYGAYTGGIDKMVIETGMTLANFDEHYAGADGNKRDWLTTKLPWRGTDGAARGVVTISLDVTDKKASERALASALVRSEAANRAKSEFLRNMSHELRTPLNAVIGFAEILASGGAAPARNGDYAQAILDSANRLLVQIETLMEIANLTGEPQSPPDYAVCPIEIADEAAQAAAAEAAARGIAIVPEIALGLPGLRVERRALRRIFDALLSNAIKFGRDGGQARIRLLRASDGGVAIAIEDDGIGIADEDLEKCVLPFEQVEKSLARKEGGLGLGLSLAKALAEAQGGRLVLESEKDRFTRVTVSFPAGRTAIAPL
ncbi:MAG: PAS domain-containing sensor histidine kinase [Alphaproteobacteria bacterium]|nr:PAS domain-containing sensor histidine kinase [Alphaproteobacteria bacterium]MCA0448518.1 PAS domain-containing sensor histidine kinase [Pseudomonadota bacterium]